MSKQVRLRRGTTVQHQTFTGADGEITFDTTRKSLVVHDGTTPGGVPIYGLVRLDSGGPFSLQTLAGCLQIDGGDSENLGLNVVHSSAFSGMANFYAALNAALFSFLSKILAFANPRVLDFESATYQFTSVALTGNLVLSSANLAPGRFILLRIVGDASVRTLTFPAGWKFMGAVPGTLAANKTGFLKLWSFGSSDSSVIAEWSVEP